MFDEASQIGLSPSHLSVSVSSLQDIKLFNSNLQIIDEAFEYLVNKSSKGEKGQYFRPRHMIDMCVKMLNPKPGEYMVDTAAGSCGFPVHTIFKITGHLFSNTEIPEEEKENVLKVFGIDFDEKVVRVARTLNLIAGDGNTNVLHLNNLDYDRWNESIQNRNWYDVYGAGLRRLEALRKDPNSYKEFNFDILMANPPFAGDIKESRIIHKYDLGYNEKNKPKSKVGRDILFIERNLNFLKPGGRMAIVLPQGRFNNTSDKAIREYIAERARILAVVGLHVNHSNRIQEPKPAFCFSKNGMTTQRLVLYAQRLTITPFSLRCRKNQARIILANMFMSKTAMASQSSTKTGILLLTTTCTTTTANCQTASPKSLLNGQNKKV